MSAHPTMLPGSSPVSSQRLFVILVLAVVALVVLPRESAAAPLVVGQDYYSVQLLSGTSAAVLQESLALVADQPYARIEKRGAEYMLRVGYWESRDEAVQAANALLPRFRGAHTRIAPYQPDAIVAGAGERPPIAAVPLPSTVARAREWRCERPQCRLVRDRKRSVRRQSLLQIAPTRSGERRLQRKSALRQKRERSGKATIRQQAEAQAEAAARSAWQRNVKRRHKPCFGKRPRLRHSGWLNPAATPSAVLRRWRSSAVSRRSGPLSKRRQKHKPSARRNG